MKSLNILQKEKTGMITNFIFAAWNSALLILIHCLWISDIFTGGKAAPSPMIRYFVISFVALIVIHLIFDLDFSDATWEAIWIIPEPLKNAALIVQEHPEAIREMKTDIQKSYTENPDIIKAYAGN